MILPTSRLPCLRVLAVVVTLFCTDAIRAEEAPASLFDTVEVRYASADNKKSWSLHCAASLNFLPVMIVFREEDKVKSRAELTDYRSGD